MTRDRDNVPSYLRALLESGWTPELALLLGIEAGVEALSRPTPVSTAAGGRGGDPVDDPLPHGR
jgi:hypothetical protein